MFCIHCGKALKEDYALNFCPNCGKRLNLSTPKNNSTTAINKLTASTQTATKAVESPSNQPDLSGMIEKAPPQKQGMIWYYILIYGILWILGVYHILLGILQLGSCMSSMSCNANMEVDPLSFILAFLYCAGRIALGAFTIYTRFSLANYEQWSIKKLNRVFEWTFSLPVALTLFQCLDMQVSQEELISSLIPFIIPLIITVVMEIVNTIYFGKRKHLFKF